ncbi:MAG: AMP-binding protein [Rhodospirillales bacterium]|nr:AMP-binding protein [Rhodospirillales bacterium]
MDVLDRFFDIAARMPDHKAVHEACGVITFGELAHFISRIAHETAVCSHPKVLICLPQGANAYAAMFATLMVGGYYAPINLDAPAERQQNVIDQFKPNVIITNTNAQNKCDLDVAQIGSAQVINLDKLGDDVLSQPLAQHELAYVIFTSGSTGIPKGVEVGRQGLGHYIDWAIQAMAPSPNDKWSQFPPISFDLSVLDIYGALCSGATLYPFTSEVDRMMPARTIQKHGLTIWNSVPSVIGMMMQATQLTTTHLRTLRLATFCGEPLLPEHLDGLFSALPNLIVHNTYGPTEATVSFTLIKLTADTYKLHCKSSAALGSPISGMELHLVGGSHSNEGEIVISGPQVAKGYWNNPKATHQAFRTLDINGVATQAYFTGDWAAYEENDLFFVSRIDFQAKINGYRIELEDINAAVRKLTSTVAYAVVVRNELHCFIEQDPKEPLNPSELVKHLGNHLETYAIPKYFHQVSRLPRNVNDKIDHRALEEHVQKNV